MSMFSLSPLTHFILKATLEYYPAALRLYTHTHTHTHTHRVADLLYTPFFQIRKQSKWTIDNMDACMYKNTNTNISFIIALKTRMMHYGLLLTLL